MPLKSTDFNQILNIAPSGHVEIIQNIIKDTSPNQEHQNNCQLHLEMSSIFEGIIDAFELNRFQLNYEYSFLGTYLVFIKTSLAS